MNNEDYNNIILNKLSVFLNNAACSITTNQINKVTSCGVSVIYAYKLLLKEYLDIDDPILINDYLDKMVFLENPNEYYQNPYYKTIKFTTQKKDLWELKKAKYQPFELFVKDDFRYFEDNKKMLPTLGSFEVPFYYLAIYQNKRLWMSITPNEINTMKEPINNAFGNVLTFGLGLGYFPFMCHLKENVQTITIVEHDKTVIKLFKEVILPQFSSPNKIKIINDEAFNFMEKSFNPNDYQFIFVDIYHDASDGTNIYKRFLPYLKKYPKANFSFWIEKTIKYYL